jgi:hypothetical protein
MTPTTQMSLDDWQQELEQLATRAEQVGADASLQDRLAVASSWFQLLWLSCDPAWIAKNCRLASRLGEPVMATPASLDEQVMSSWEARSAALKSVGALKDLPPAPVGDPALIEKPLGRPRRKKPEPEPVPVVDTEPARIDVRERIKAAVQTQHRELRPRSERVPGRPAPAPEPVVEAAAAQSLTGSFAEAGDNQHTLKEGGVDNINTMRWNPHGNGDNITLNDTGKGTSAAYPAPEPEPDADDDAPMPSGWGNPEQVLEELEPLPPAPEPETLTAVQLAAWWGMSLPWTHSLHRRGVVEAGVHFRRHQPGERKGNRYFLAAHQAISESTGKPIPPEPLQTVEECLRPRMKRRVRGYDEG